MFIHNINPVLFDLGFIEIRWYGIIYALGFLLALWWLKYLRSIGKLEITPDEVSDFIFYLIIGVLVGARLFEVFVWNWSYYSRDLIQILYFWRGGLSFHGGLLGGIIAVWFFLRGKRHVTFLQLADALMVPAFIGTAFGRIGNFINGELPGRVTSVDWCVVFPNVEGCRHPQMLYSFLGRFLGGVTLFFLSMQDRKPGIVFGWGLVLFAVERFVVDFFREDVLYYSLTTGQWLSIPVLLGGAGLLVYLAYSNKDNTAQNI